MPCDPFQWGKATLFTLTLTGDLDLVWSELICGARHTGGVVTSGGVPYQGIRGLNFLRWERLLVGCSPASEGPRGAVLDLSPPAPAYTYILPPSSRWRCSGPPSPPWPGVPRCAPHSSTPPPLPPKPQLSLGSARRDRRRPGTPGSRTHCCGFAWHPPRGRARSAGRGAAAPPRAAVPGGGTLGSAET